MKNMIIKFALLCCCILMTSGCDSNNVNNNAAYNEQENDVEITEKITIADEPIDVHDNSSDIKDTSNEDEDTLFTNKYGTPTTLCAHSGCTNYIASSGDTNCCTIHSNKCANCGKYIDEDAFYCIDCLASSSSSGSSYGSSYSSSSSSYSSSSSFTNKYGTPTTMCAHKGCTNYIASSGDTNCCTIHSKNCANCGKYIDEDAFYCTDCLIASLN